MKNKKYKLKKWKWHAKILIASVSSLLIDRILKVIAVHWSGFFVIRETVGAGFGLVKNFGIGLSITLPPFITIPLTIGILGIMGGVLYSRAVLQNQEKKDSLLALFGMLLLFVGGLSNLFDRIAYTYVIDYFSLYIKSSGFAFNVADILIVVGTGTVLLAWGRKRAHYGH